MDLGVWQEECNGWAQLFGFAAGLSLREPSMDQLANCRSVGEELKAHLPEEAFPQLLLAVKKEDIDAIRQEFFDLFFVPVSGSYSSPYEALQPNNGRHNEAGGNIGRIYAATGFTPGLLADIPSYLKRLNRPDYIGFELAFMANVFRAASQGTDPEEISALRHTAVLFHEKHLSRWATAFGHQVAQKAQSSYFRACGECTAYMAGAFSLEE